jgi:hypothetical protein
MIEDFGTAVRPSSLPEAPRAGGLVRGVNEEKNQPKTRLIQWAGYGPDRYAPCERTWPILPGGVYTIDMEDGKIVFTNQPVNIDDLFYFEDSIGDQVLLEVETFWNAAELYEQRGFKHRRGYLLYGPQGSGKSSIVQQIIARIKRRAGVVFLATCQPGLLTQALTTFRLVEPTRPVLVIFEDIDAIIQSHGEKEILSLLDGESQIDFVLNLATTNYPEKLDKRLVSRPRRFDRIIKVGMPSAVVRAAYLWKKLPDSTPSEIDHLVKESEGFSFAAMAEIIISIKCLGNDLTDTLVILKEMHKRLPNSREYDTNQAGFGSGK